MNTSVPSRPAPGAATARLVAVPALRERAVGPILAVRGRPGGTGPATVLVRALPHAGPSARIGVPGVVHAALLALVAGQCVVLDAAGHGVPAGATLLVVTLSVALLLRYGMARPGVTMRHAALHAVEEPPASAIVTPLLRTRGERATGGPVPPRAPALPHSRIAELARIRRTVLAVGARRSDPGARWCHWPAGAVMAVAVAPVLVWSVLVATAPAPAPVGDPVVATAAQEGTRVDVPPGGTITPGWLALTPVEEPRRFLLVAAVTVLTYLGTLGLMRVAILYGRRLFAAFAAVVLLTTAVFLVVQDRAPLPSAHQTLGFVVPGLVTHQLLRRPVVPTAAATAGVTATSWALMVSGLLSGLVVAT